MKVFLSYRFTDKIYVDQIINEINTRIKSIDFISLDHLKKDWVKQVESLIKEADVVLFFIGSNTYESKSIHKEYEITKALNKRFYFTELKTDNKSKVFTYPYFCIDNKALHVANHRMKMIVEGIMGGKLPWTLVFIGVFLAIGLEILRIPVMPFAIGLYLPIYLNAAIMIGGVVRMFVDGRKNVDDKKKEEQATDGTLYCAGMIAGEGLVGILLAILAVVNVSSVFDLSGSINLGNAGGVILMLLMILSLLKFSIWNKKKA